MLHDLYLKRVDSTFEYMHSALNIQGQGQSQGRTALHIPGILSRDDLSVLGPQKVGSRFPGCVAHKLHIFTLVRHPLNLTLVNPWSSLCNQSQNMSSMNANLYCICLVCTQKVEKNEPIVREKECFKSIYACAYLIPTTCTTHKKTSYIQLNYTTL